MPAGKVFAELDAHGEQIAERALVQEAAKDAKRRVEAKLVADEADEPPALDLGGELVNAVERARDRLLDEEVAAGSRGRERNANVEAVGVGDEDGIGFLGESRAEVVEAANTECLLDLAVRRRGEIGPDQRAGAPHAVGEQVDVV